MRVQPFYRLLRSLTYFVLFFFVWDFLPVYPCMAYAAAPQGQGTGGAGRPATAEQRQQTAGERFEKALVDIREKVGRAGEKHARGEDDSAEISEIRNRKTQLADLNQQLQAEFAATDKKIAGLPREIQDRHTAFVKNYTANYTQLRDELNDIDGAKTPADRKVKIEKVRQHLEKTKPKKHVQRLDPEKLPFRARKSTKTVAPRLKKEEFEKDFPLQKSHGKQRVADSHLMPKILASKPQPKPVLLAFNETASDIPLSLGGQLSHPQLAFNDFTPLLLAQAGYAPTADDLAENGIEIQFTDAIRAKAQELGCSPVKLYEFTRNEIFFTPTYGSIQGADMCLQTKECNSFDTSSLLISLLRSCSIPARYSLQTAEIPIDKIMNMVGNFTDPMAALTLVASGGIPVAAKVSGGKIVAARIETVVTEAWVDMIPSRGAVHKEGDSWVQLDSTIKDYAFKQGIDVQAVTGVNAQNFSTNITASSTIDPTTNAITAVPVTDIQNQLNTMITSLNNHVTNNMPDATIGDVLGGKTIVKQKFRILPASLPYKVIAAGASFSQMPDNLRQKITITIDSASGSAQSLTYAAPLAQLATKRLTLSYMPATDADAQTLSTYGYYNVKPYLIKLKPGLYIDGTPVAFGDSIGMGAMQDISVTFTLPDGSVDRVAHKIPASTFASIGLDLQRIPLNLLTERKTKLDQALSQLGTQEVPVDDVIGEILNLHSLAYFFQLEIMNRLTTQGKVTYSKQPEEMLTTLSPNIGYLYGMPFSISGLGMKVDVRRYVMSVVSLAGDVTQEKAFMLVAGHNSSAMEHAVFEEMSPDTQGVSSVKIISEAMKQGIPIYEINSSNIGDILPRLQITSETKENIINAIASGKKVYVPERSVQYYDWYGDGYEIIDPATNAGAYMITGGLAGGGNAQSSSNPASVIGQLLLSISFSTLREAFRQIATAASNFSPAVNVLRQWAGPLAALINGVFAGLNMWQDTHNPWSGVAAGLGTAGIGVLAWAFLFYTLPLVVFAGPLGIVFLIAMITVAVLIWQTILLDYIRTTATASFHPRNHYYAKRYLYVT